MEDIYTIKIKTKPDVKNLYPSERRYSASTVKGLAFIHLSLAFLSLLFTCLIFGSNEDFYNTNSNSTSNFTAYISIENNYILIIAPSLVTLVALIAGFASILASVKWYIDRNITILLLSTVLSTIVSCISCLLLLVYISLNYVENGRSQPVLVANMLITCVLELVWSVLSVRISYKGMRNSYKENEGGVISVVKKVKGNKLPRPDLLNLPGRKLKSYFMNESYLKNDSVRNDQFYKDKMMNYLNECEVENTERSHGRVTPVSWGDTPNHTIYNQNNVDFDKLFKFDRNDIAKTESGVTSENKTE